MNEQMNNNLTEVAYEVQLEDISGWLKLVADTRYLGIQPQVASMAGKAAGAATIFITAKAVKKFTASVIRNLIRKGASEAALKKIAQGAAAWSNPYFGWACILGSTLSLVYDVTKMVDVPTVKRINAMLGKLYVRGEQIEDDLHKMLLAVASPDGPGLNPDACADKGYALRSTANYGSPKFILSAVLACFYHRTGEGDIDTHVGKALMYALIMNLYTGLVPGIFIEVIAACCRWYHMHFAYCSDDAGSDDCVWSLHVGIMVQEIVLMTSRMLPLLKRYRNVRNFMNAVRLAPTGINLVYTATQDYGPAVVGAANAVKVEMTSPTAIVAAMDSVLPANIRVSVDSAKWAAALSAAGEGAIQAMGSLRDSVHVSSENADLIIDAINDGIDIITNSKE